MIFNNKMAILEVMNKSNGNVRNSNIELLRIITILGVFFLHLYNPLIGGGIKLCNSQINEFLLRILESQFVCSVNLLLVSAKKSILVMFDVYFVGQPLC